MNDPHDQPGETPRARAGSRGREFPTAHRYAIYFTPRADHPLARAGSGWLGRNPEAGRPSRVAEPCDAAGDSPESCAGLPSEIRDRVVAPARRYGFHATLKPPFRPAHGITDARVLAAVRRVAAAHSPFPMPALAVGRLGDFLALRPSEPAQTGEVARPHAGDAWTARSPLRRLADACVRALDGLRAPPEAAETAHRLAAGLDPVERSLLARWGYPYVMERWRLHLTLTRHFEEFEGALLSRVERAAHTWFGPALDVPLACEDLCVFVEPSPGADFVLRERVPLG